MNLKSSMLTYANAAECRSIANKITDQPELFDELIQHFLCNDYRTVQRASNIVNICVEKEPDLIYPYLDEIVNHLDRNTQNTKKRNILRMLQFVEIPETHFGKLADICFNFLGSVNESVANRVFAMTVIYQIVTKVPELKDELKMTIEDHLPYGSAAFKSRGKKILNKLRTLES